MKNFLEQVRDERQLKALIGLDRNHFDKLREEFSKSLSEMATENYKTNREKRKRRPGGGQKGKLVTAENKLCLVLFYLKNYPTFDLLGYMFELSRSKAEENLKKQLPIVKKAQSKLEVLPSQRIKSVKELEELVSNAANCKEPKLTNSTDTKSSPPVCVEVDSKEPKPIHSQEPKKGPPCIKALVKEPPFLIHHDEPPKNVESPVKVRMEVDSKEHKSIFSQEPKKGPPCAEALVKKEMKEPPFIILNPRAPEGSPQSVEILNELNSIDSGLTRSQEANKPPNYANASVRKEGTESKFPKWNCTKEVSLPLTREINIDVTERSHFRHKNYQEQKRHFSGKSKRHALKNTIISTKARQVLYVGPCFKGSTHDYKMFKKEFCPKKDWFKNISACVDLAYQGIKTDYLSDNHIHIPHKKPRKSSKRPNPSLTKKQREKNRNVSSRRVVVEHAIGGMKAFNILSSQFRNKKKSLADEAILIVAGLWNLKISA